MSDHNMYCGKCRRALSRIHGRGPINYMHAYEVNGRGKPDHAVQPIPLAEVTDPIIDCDFCCYEVAAYIYVCVEQQTSGRTTQLRNVSATDFHGSITKGRLHRVDRSRKVETEKIMTHMLGEKWAACKGCAEPIEERNVLALVSRVTAAMPRRVTQGKRLLETRGKILTAYEAMFATMKPGRYRITPENPLGVWEPPHDATD